MAFLRRGRRFVRLENGSFYPSMIVNMMAILITVTIPARRWVQHLYAIRRKGRTLSKAPFICRFIRRRPLLEVVADRSFAAGLPGVTCWSFKIRTQRLRHLR